MCIVLSTYLHCLSVCLVYADLVNTLALPFNFDSNYYLSTSGVAGGLNGADQEGAKGAYKIVGATGVTVTPSTAEDLQHGGVKYFVSGKSVTVTLSGGSSYSAVDGASNPVALTDNGGGSYTLTMPASDVTISAN